MMYNFACVCYGDKYPVEYVQKLYNMVTRNTTLHINFFVFIKLQKPRFKEIDDGIFTFIGKNIRPARYVLRPIEE